MGQPYQENPEDIFDPVNNPTDWLELIDSASSPSEEHFSRNGQEASLVGYIPWNKRRSATRYFLGFAQVTGSNTLTRENPEAHPVYPWLYADSISFKSFNPMANPANPDSALRFISPWFGNGLVTIDVANHRLAVTNVTFKSFRNSFMDDIQISDPRMEWMRNVYIDIDPRVEVLSADGVSQLIFAEGVSSGPGGPTAGTTPFPAPVPELLGKSAFTLNWVDVPFEYLSAEEDYFYPSNIMACLGKVNSDNFPYGSSDPFLPGQLLFESVKFTQKVFPVASSDPSSPLIAVDVSMTLNYFNPPKGNTSSSFFGHNLMPWRGGYNPATAESDGTGGLFFYCTRGGTADGPPLLQSTAFNNMFLSPNA